MTRFSMKRRTRGGNYTMIVGITIPVIFGFTAIALDIAYLELARTQAQNVADAASHAAFAVYRDTLDVDLGIEAATYIVEHNSVGDGLGTLAALEYGGWDPLDGNFSVANPWTNAVKVQVSRSGTNHLPPLMSVVFGNDGWDIFSDAVTAGTTRELMVVQDITGSMATQMDDARAANLALLDYLINSPYPDDQVGMVTFVGGVQDVPWSPLTKVEGNEDATEALWATLDVCNCNVPWYEAACQLNPPVEGNSADYDTCWEWFCDIEYGNINENPHMQDCFEEGSQTNPGPGVSQAVDEILAKGDPTAFEGIILVSDGLPCCGELVAEREAEGIAAVDYAYDNGIHVWSIGLNDEGDDFTYLEGLIRGYGQFYETPDSDELAGIMLDVATSIPVMLVQ